MTISDLRQQIMDGSKKALITAAISAGATVVVSYECRAYWIEKGRLGPFSLKFSATSFHNQLPHVNEGDSSGPPPPIGP